MKQFIGIKGADSRKYERESGRGPFFGVQFIVGTDREPFFLLDDWGEVYQQPEPGPDFCKRGMHMYVSDPSGQTHFLNQKHEVRQVAHYKL